MYEKCDFDVSIKGERYNVYSDDIRKTVISLACNYGVAASNVQKVIQAVAQNIFKYTFEDNLPSTQTVLNMIDEAYVVSQVQVMEGILNSNDATLHSDGTRRDHKKIVSHQLSLSNGETFYLDFYITSCI